MAFAVFWMTFSNTFSWMIYQNVIEVCCLGLNWQPVSIGSCNASYVQHLFPGLEKWRMTRQPSDDPGKPTMLTRKCSPKPRPTWDPRNLDDWTDEQIKHFFEKVGIISQNIMFHMAQDVCTLHISYIFHDVLSWSTWTKNLVDSGRLKYPYLDTQIDPFA